MVYASFISIAIPFPLDPVRISIDVSGARNAVAVIAVFAVHAAPAGRTVSAVSAFFAVPAATICNVLLCIVGEFSSECR